MGRTTIAGKTPLLENADQNIGNSAILIPQAGNSGVVIPQTNPPRLLNLSGGSAAGKSMSIVMTVSRLLSAQNPNPGFPGPITGVIEFGNGGRVTKMEVDLTVGPFAGSVNRASNAVEPQDGVTIVTVPTGVLRVYARYDNLLLAPLIGSNPPISHAELSGVPVIGPGGPLTCTNPSPPPATIVIPPEPVLVQAMAMYLGKNWSRSYRTLNCYLSSQVAVPTTITIGNPAISDIGLFTGFAFWTLPAFTRKATVQRFPNTTALEVLLHDGIRPTEFFSVAGGAPSPTYDVVGNQNIIGIRSLAPVSMLKIVCEVGI